MNWAEPFHLQSVLNASLLLSYNRLIYTGGTTAVEAVAAAMGPRDLGGPGRSGPAAQSDGS